MLKCPSTASEERGKYPISKELLEAKSTSISTAVVVTELTETH